MNVQFYINTSPSIKVNKTLTAEGSERACDIIGTVDVMNPTIVVKGSVDSSINYMKIGSPLDRYYFITAMDYTTAGSVIITGHVDVLRTYKGFLEQTTLNYCRGSGDITEMDDASYPISDYMIQQYFPLGNWTDIFHNSGSGRQFLLRTIKGSGADIGSVYQLNVGGAFWCGETYMDSNDSLHYIIYFVEGISGTNKLQIEKAYQSELTPGIPYLSEDDYLQIPNPNYPGRNGLWQYTGGMGNNPQSLGAWSYKGLTT